jgi:hypothetical protein
MQTGEVRVRYVIAWLPKDGGCLIASAIGSKVGRDEGWYRLVYDEKGREAIEAGPCATAASALNTEEQS